MKKGIKVIIIFALAIALMGSGFWLVHRFIESKEQQESFRELAESVLLEVPAAVPADPSPPLEDPGQIIRPIPSPAPSVEVLHDLAALREKNPDCIGWLRVPGTAIDYPIMWTPDDPEKYLHLDFYGGWSDYGVPFLDARCDLDSGNLIIYGHNMFDGTMFAGLHKFLDESYADAHSQIVLETPEGAREYNLFAVCRANSMVSGCYRHINFADRTEMDDFLESVRAESVYYAEPDYEKFITLSTCDDWGRNDRIVVIGGEVPC